jgi:hypothetical protein
MPEINLLNAEARASQKSYGVVASVITRMLGFLLFLAVVIFIILFVFNWMNERSLKNVQADIKSAQASALADDDRNELVTRQEQLENLETLVDNHVYWSYLLPELARVTLKSARYSEIEASSDGKLDITVNLPNYEEIEKYMQIFDLPEYNQQFSNVRIVSINTVQADNAIQTELRLQLTFNPQYIKGRM